MFIIFQKLTRLLLLIRWSIRTIILPWLLSRLNTIWIFIMWLTKWCHHTLWEILTLADELLAVWVVVYTTSISLPRSTPTLRLSCLIWNNISTLWSRGIHFSILMLVGLLLEKHVVVLLTLLWCLIRIIKKCILNIDSHTSMFCCLWMVVGVIAGTCTKKYN